MMMTLLEPQRSMFWLGKLVVFRGLKVESPKKHRTHAETRMCTIYTFNEQNLMIGVLLG